MKRVLLGVMLLLLAVGTAAPFVWRAVSTRAVDGPVQAPPRAGSSFPSWANTATVAGAAFDPDDPWSENAAKVDALVAQGTGAVVADCPLGWSYEAWNDDPEFDRNLDLVRRVVTYAHSKGLRVVWYVTGLEFVSEGGTRNPAEEHPAWPQRSIDGTPIAFNDIGNSDEHWLNPGDWDVWVSPDDPTLRDLYMRRIRALAGAGMDGLWVDTVYLQDAIGLHESMWPSFDSASVKAFRRDTGLNVPKREDWDSRTWKKWLLWRHRQLKRFLVDIKREAQSVKPDIFVFEENWCADSAGATTYANDPLAYADQPGLSTGHEVSTIGDRIDEGETGMAAATVTNWRDFATMIKFARGADGVKPSWILTYGYRSADAMRLAGVIAAAGANYYETQGPGMDGSVGSRYRRTVFGWTRQFSGYLFGRRRAPRVALLYSGVSRDFIDGGSGEYYSVGDSEFFRNYRAAARSLVARHVSFEIVPDTTLTAEALRPYAWVVEPAQAVSDSQAAALKTYVTGGGKLVLLADAGTYDEWGDDRPANTFAGVTTRDFNSLLAAESNNAALGSSTYLETGWAGRWQVAVVVNFARATRHNVPLGLRTPRGRRASVAYTSAPGQTQRRAAIIGRNSRWTTVRIPALGAFALVRARF